MSTTESDPTHRPPNPQPLLTPEDLKKILRECAGEDDSVSLEGDFLDTPFLDLGYDSLALLEAAALVKRQFGVTIADDDLHGIETPRGLLDKVNSELSPV